MEITTRENIRTFTTWGDSEREALFSDIVTCSKERFEDYAGETVALTSLHFGRKREIFNPIYVSNVCVNDCLYCGYRQSNKSLRRRSLSAAQSLQEAQYVVSRGVKNLLILAGEYPDPHYFSMLLDNIACIARVEPAWLGIEVAPLDANQYRQLSQIGVDSLIIFQETYDEHSYTCLHGISAPKSDFRYRYEAPFRAIEGGITEIGLGVLYGLHDWISDTLAMVRHADEIIAFHPDAKLRFSFPRMQPSDKQEPGIIKQEVTETILRRIMVAIRTLFPKAKLVLTARETQQFRLANMDIVTTTGENGCTSVGGYTVYPDTLDREAQFQLPGRRSIDELTTQMRKIGYIPS